MQPNCSLPAAATPHNFPIAYRPDIDGLRALAILSVVLFHAFPSWMPGGFVGVDVFFVISGFLISSIIFSGLHKGHFSFSEFYGRRIRRIFPALTLVLVASLALGWFALLTDEFLQLGKHVAAGAGFVQNFVLWTEAGYFDKTSELKPMMHLWSLAIEEQFYVIYPVIVWILWRLDLSIGLILVAVTILLFGLNVDGIGKDATKVFFFPQTRFWELLVGGVLAYRQLNSGGGIRVEGSLSHHVSPPVTLSQRFQAVASRAIPRNLVSSVGVLLILGAVFGLREGSAFPGWWATVPVLGALLLILAGRDSWINRKLLASPVMIFIGLVSYPLYLWHWPLLSFARIVEGAMPPLSVRIGLLALSLVLAWLTFRYVEKPIRFSSESHTLRSKAIWLLAVILLVGSFGYWVNRGSFENLRNRDLIANADNFRWEGLFENSLCRSAFPDFKGKFCTLQDDRKPTIALVGDSHVMVLNYGLVKHAGPGENVVNFGGPSCLPFFDADFHSTGLPFRATGRCKEDINHALSVVENTASIDIVILGSRALLTDLSGGQKGAYQRRMRHTLERLTSKGKRVVYVMDFPELGVDPQVCVRSPVLFMGPGRRCEVSLEQFEERTRGYRNLVHSVLKDFPDVLAFDPSSVLCANGKCPVVSDGKSLYIDRDHLSITGSLLVSERLVHDM